MEDQEIIDKAMSFGCGGMTRGELRYLQVVCEDCKVLELGSHVGQSSFVIAHSAKELSCVDAWIDGTPFLEENQRDIYAQQPEGMRKRFLENTKSLNNIKSYKGLTTDFKDSFKDLEFDLVLIDSDHSYEGVKEAIKDYKDKAKVLIFHDYKSGSWPGVTEAIEKTNLTHIGGVGKLGVFINTEVKLNEWRRIQ